MNNKKKIILLFFLGLFLVITSYATVEETNNYKNPYYVGITFGYGATTWGFLIPPDENAAMALSTPVSVDENGETWGIFAGYEFIPSFALESSYQHYPRAEVFFDPLSLFTFEHNGLTSFFTNTESLSLVGKFMLIIPHNEEFRAFSSVGAAAVHRDDIIADKWPLSPKFGVGLDYALSEHIMFELGIDYTAGDAVSELNPANSFIPFLYSIYGRFALRL
jgi:hypothetical protein